MLINAYRSEKSICFFCDYFLSASGTSPMWVVGDRVLAENGKEGDVNYGCDLGVNGRIEGKQLVPDENRVEKNG